MNDPTLLESLEWDTNHFGFPVARLKARALDAETALSVRETALSKNVRCVYFLAEANDAVTWRNAMSVGFEPVDIRVELSRRVRDMPAPNPREHFTLAQPSDLPELLQLSTAEAFADSRFVRDQRFPRVKVRELFELWITRGVEQGFVLCSRSATGGSINGFLSGSLSGEVARIELLSVIAAAQGKGIGSLLVSAAITEFRKRGATEIGVVTQGANLGAQRAYQRGGFTTSACGLWFHLWLQELGR